MGGSRVGKAEAGGVAALAVLALWLAVDPLGGGTSSVVSAVSQSGAALFAGLMAARTAAAHSGRHRRAWQLLSAAGIAWAAANALWTWSDLTRESGEVFPAVSDLGFLLLLPLAAVALLLHPAAPRSGSALIRLAVDAAIGGGAVLFVTRSLFTSGAHEAARPNVFENPVGVAYAVGDIIVMGLAVLLAVQAHSRWRRSLVLVALAFVAHAIADVGFTYLTLDGRYTTGSIIDMLWVAGFLLLANAAAVEWTAERHTAPSPKDEPTPSPTPGYQAERPSTLVLPYGLVGVAIVVGIVDLASDGEVEILLRWVAVAIGTLVAARQVVDRVHNARLLRSLESTVVELRDRDAKLAEAQEVAQLGSWAWDAATDAVTVTDEVFSVLGIPATESPLRVETLLSAVHPDDSERVYAAATDALVRHEPFELDLRLASEDGRIVHSRGRPVTDDEASTLRVVGTVQDVTTVRRLARELEQRLAELERSNADLTNFASLASHDLAAPVQLVAGYLRTLRDQLRKLGLSDEVELTDGAIEGARRLEELIHDILAYSLATTSDLDLVTDVDVDRIAREAARTVGSDDWAARVEIDSLPRVRAHPGQLRQLFQNLLSNALKFVPADRTPHVRVWADHDDGVWRFSVADNGIGIPAENRERMFRMFERGEGLDVGGTGIGLAICTRIVSRHGGHLWVEEAPGGGSVFRFTLGSPASIDHALTNIAPDR